LCLATISQQRPASGKVGTPSNMTVVAPASSGPYTMYEWPVIHPMSAVHQGLTLVHFSAQRKRFL